MGRKSAFGTPKKVIFENQKLPDDIAFSYGDSTRARFRAGAPSVRKLEGSAESDVVVERSEKNSFGNDDEKNSGLSDISLEMGSSSEEEEKQSKKKADVAFEVNTIFTENRVTEIHSFLLVFCFGFDPWNELRCYVCVSGSGCGLSNKQNANSDSLS